MDDEKEEKEEKNDLGNEKQKMITNVYLKLFVKELKINHHDSLTFFF